MRRVSFDVGASSFLDSHESVSRSSTASLGAIPESEELSVASSAIQNARLSEPSRRASTSAPESCRRRLSKRGKIVLVALIGLVVLLIAAGVTWFFVWGRTETSPIILGVTVTADNLEAKIDGVESAGKYKAKISWGDGAEGTVRAYDSAALMHGYDTPGAYNVTITGTFPGFTFATDPSKLTSVYQLGNTGLTTLAGAFKGCSNLVSVGGDAALGHVTDMTNTFYFCTSLASLDVSGWDMSSVTSMDSMFYYCPNLTSLDISTWDTSSVTDMRYMFSGCTGFTSSIDNDGWSTDSLMWGYQMCDGCPANTCTTLSPS